MSLTHQDKEDVAHIISALNKTARDNKTMGELFMRIGVTVCAAGIIGIATLIFGMRYDLQATILETQYLREEFKDYKTKTDSFFAVPRFSKADFETSIQPLAQRVELNTIELANKKLWASQMEPIVRSNERDIKFIKDDLSEIKELLNTLLKEKVK